MKKIYPFLEGAIPVEFISESIQSHTHNNEIGGHSIFLGQVRADIIDGKEVEGIEFTSYQEMAIEQLSQIKEEIFTKYDLLCMHVHHSLGMVKKGEICLFVFTSSKHRKPAILACDELVERIKKELPIWGKEIFSDSSYQWKENKQ
ncbi:MAG: molybdenum cofactor biosynthesis protein MoaE [Apibacter sp.]|jgi:molybdopterin synthase catalytic subunit|nr:molybdenum cofactor biosynthesis protein MoaE [Apibacter sp.]